MVAAERMTEIICSLWPWWIWQDITDLSCSMEDFWLKTTKILVKVRVVVLRWITSRDLAAKSKLDKGLLNTDRLFFCFEAEQLTPARDLPQPQEAVVIIFTTSTCIYQDQNSIVLTLRAGSKHHTVPHWVCCQGRWESQKKRNIPLVWKLQQKAP